MPPTSGDTGDGRRPVLLRNRGTGVTVLVRSAVRTARTTVWRDGRTYPLVLVGTGERRADG